MKRKWVKDASVSKCSKKSIGCQSSSSPLSCIVPLKTCCLRNISGALSGADIHKSCMQLFYKQPSCMIASTPSSFFVSFFSTSYCFLLPAPWLLYKLYEAQRLCHNLQSRYGIFIDTYRFEDFHSFCTDNPTTDHSWNTTTTTEQNGPEMCLYTLNLRTSAHRWNGASTVTSIC